jgi:speckle-type POZ protein
MWNIRFYPGGRNDAAAGIASVYLVCLGLQPKDGLRAKFTLRVLDDQGNDQGINKDFVIERMHTAKSSSYGFREFVEKSKLLSISRLDGGNLTIRCVLAVIKEPPTEYSRPPIVIPTPGLGGDLERTLKNGRGADVTLLVGGREFRAHRHILAARSPVFDAQLFGPLMDKDTQHIEVDDMEPTIFEMLLHFVYTDSLPPCNKGDYDVALMQHLLVAADRYGLDGLKVMCEEKLYNSIDVKTVTSTLALADQHYCERLKDACVKFLSKPGVTIAVILSEGFKSFLAGCPPLGLGKDRKD